MNFLLQFDTDLFLFLNHLPHNFILDYFFGALSLIGEYGIIWFLITLLLSLKYQPQKRWSFVAKIYLAGFFSLLLVFVLKKVFGRERPEFGLQDVIMPFGPDSSFSFPSGHALLSFTFVYLLTKCYPKSDHKTKLSEARSEKLEIGNGNGKTEVGITSQNISFQYPASHFSHLTSNLFFYLLAVLISFSRIYLGQHYPLDVVGGAVIGIIIAKVVTDRFLRLRTFEDNPDSLLRHR